MENKVFLVGIGASAGGLEALQAFLGAIPPTDIDIAYVLVQHLSPRYDSMMVQLLTRVTDIRIVLVTEDKKIRPRTIYQIAPGSHIEIDGSWVRFRAVSERQVGDHNTAVNVMLCSLANSCGSLCGGVILSGTGSDGRAGIVRIKEKGGVVFVQEPSTAKFDGMPAEAIGTGLVDFIASPEKIAVEVVRIAAKLIQQRDFPAMSKPEVVLDILGVLRELFYVNFEEYKLSTVCRRIQNRMKVVGFDTVEEYHKEVCSNADEAAALYNNILIGVTAFMRDAEYWKVISDKVIPTIVASAAKEKRPIRVWSAGCSSGEESYSIAILLHEYMETTGTTVDFKVYATDIDDNGLYCASMGIYPEEALIGDYKSKYFFPVKGGYQISRTLRSHMLVTKHNMTTDPPFKDMDLIICRNVLIYFGSSLQNRVLRAFHFGLCPGGFLFLGSGETVDHTESKFSVLAGRARVFVKHETNGSSDSAAGNDMFTGSGFKYTNYGTGSISTASKVRHEGVGTPPNHELPSRVRRDGTANDKFSIPMELVEVLCSKFHLPCALMNKHKQVLHTFGDFKEFLSPCCNLADEDALEFRRELSEPIEIALPKAFEMGRTVMYKNILLIDDDGESSQAFVSDDHATGEPTANVSTTFIDIVVSPLERYIQCVPVFAVFFVRSNSWAPGASGRAGPHTLTGAVFDDIRAQLSMDAEERILELERTLAATQKSLRKTVVQLETSNEELQSTNQELVASNEELQSTNEELQSVNEELYTVNGEHGTRIEELQQTYNDISTLVNATGVPTVFLDSELVVRKFTALMNKVMTIRAGDVGRPFGEILFHKPGIPMVQVKSDLQKCLRDGDVIRHILKATWGGAITSYLMTIRRNMNSQGEDCGNELIPSYGPGNKLVALQNQPKHYRVVITFTDVAEVVVPAVHVYSFGSGVGNPVILISKDDGVLHANDLALELFGCTELADIVGVHVSSLYKEKVVQKTSQEHGMCRMLHDNTVRMYMRVTQEKGTMMFFFEKTNEGE